MPSDTVIVWLVAVPAVAPRSVVGAMVSAGLTVSVASSLVSVLVGMVKVLV